MDLLSREDLRMLLQERGGPCVSIFMPTHRVGKATEQGAIRLKNLLREAEAQLTATGVRTPDAKALLAPAWELVDDTLFWSYQSDGLALFFAREMFHQWRLPIRFDALVVVTDRFHIKPLLSLFTGDGRFHVLALSQKQVRLFLGTRYSMTEISLEAVPSAMADVLRPDRVEQHLQFHTGTSGGRGKRAAMFHGQGGADAHHKADILRFFQTLDQHLRSFLAAERAPLVVAGVDYLLPLYREASSYPHLVADGVTGNPDHLSPEDLHAQAWAVVEPYFRLAQEEAAAQFADRLGTGLASASLDEVAREAQRGRVETLFVAVGVQRWGQIDPKSGQVHVHEDPEPGDQDLLDLAAVQALLGGGTVYAVAPGQVPQGADLAAVFRY